MVVHEWPVVSGQDLSRALISQVAAIHHSELSGGFLSSLGLPVLETIFLFARDSRHGDLIAALDQANERVAGFVLGSIDPGQFFREFLKSRFFAALRVFAPRLLSVRRLRRAAETLLYPHKRPRIALPQAELFDLAVSREYQRKGCGQAIFRAFVEVMRARGISRFRISSGEGLAGAHAFYESMGASKAGEFELHRGEKTLVYVYRIHNEGLSER